MSIIVDGGYWESRKRRSLHTHRNPGLEMVCLCGGRASWQVEGERFDVPANSVFFTWPWETHGGIDDAQPGLELWYVIIRMARAWRRRPARLAWHPRMALAQRDAAWLRRTLGGCEQRVLPLSDRLLRLVRDLVENHRRAAPGAATLSGALAGAAVVELTRLAAGDAGDQADERAAGERRVAGFVARLSERCHQPWSVESMAAACGLSRSRFTELVRAQTGDPPTMLLNRLRVRRAQAMLAATERKVIDVALACGFSSAAYFCRVFREYSGMTPTAWRDEMDENAPSRSNR